MRHGIFLPGGVERVAVRTALLHELDGGKDRCHRADADALQLDVRALGVHAQGYRGVGAKGAQQEIEGRRPDIVANDTERFVGNRAMFADGDRLLLSSQAILRHNHSSRHDCPVNEMPRIIPPSAWSECHLAHVPGGLIAVKRVEKLNYSDPYN